eukprot:GFYU01029908.1.p1 GENE.GFYU01029908.1~~GFYU01029908.1.p1  ORF type:complete len:266 (+),score=59.82 GFYU01029908.1:37-834(+)
MSLSKLDNAEAEPLWKRLAVDFTAAGLASTVLSPWIQVVDVSIIKNANGSEPLSVGIKSGVKDIMTKPWTFFKKREFWVVWALYFGTYAAANSASSVCDNMNTSDTIPKFMATTAVNLPGCIYKDRTFTRWFGVVEPKPVPVASLGLFAARDCLTMLASFTLVKPGAKLITESTGMEHKQAMVISQLACPALVQFVSTPIHLMGLDLYNNPARVSSDRMKFVQKEYFKSTMARQLRIGFAFGIGGVGNRWVHQKLCNQVGLKHLV